MDRLLNPTDVVFAVMGGIPATAKICGVHRTAPHTWERAGKRRPAGSIPPEAQRRLLAHAEAHGIPLTAEHLIRGATQAELDALLAQLAPASPSNPIAAE